MKTHDGMAPQEAPPPRAAEWFAQAEAAAAAPTARTGAAPAPDPLAALRAAEDEVDAARARLVDAEAEAAARAEAPLSLPADTQKRLTELQQAIGRTPADDHPALDALHGEIAETRLSGQRAARADRERITTGRVEDARRALVEAESRRNACRIPALLFSRSAAAERLQAAFTALREAMSEVEAGEQEVQRFVQSGACPNGAGKDGLKGLHYTLRRRLAQNLHAAGAIWGPDAASGIDVVDLGEWAKAQASRLMAALPLTKGTP